MNHTLMTLTEFRDHPHTRPLALFEVRMIEANIAAGNAVRMCRCSEIHVALEFFQIDAKHRAHIQDIVNERRS